MTMVPPGGLLRRVFSKELSCKCNERSSSVGAPTKNKWVHSVRIYLCGNEVNTKPTEKEIGEEQDMENSASSKNSYKNLINEQNSIGIHELYEDTSNVQDELQLKLWEERAAIAIQSAFKGFAARTRFKDRRKGGEQKQGANYGENTDNNDLREYTDAATAATSTEVKIEESFSTLKLSEANVTLHSRGFSKGRHPVPRVKEEWDDSTVSSNISKMRAQNRLEATTRRERALAYAFSQQLRTCTSKKNSSRFDSTEPNMSWSWLERWMATRTNPESNNRQPNDCISKNLGEVYTRTCRKTILMKNRRLDVSFEGRESCGSNDVSVNFKGLSAKSQSITASLCNRIVKNKSKASASRSMTRRKILSESHCNNRSKKVIKKENSKQEKSSNLQEARNCNTSQPSV